MRKTQDFILNTRSCVSQQAPRSTCFCFIKGFSKNPTDLDPEANTTDLYIDCPSCSGIKLEGTVLLFHSDGYTDFVI